MHSEPSRASSGPAPPGPARPRLGVAFGGGGMKGWSHVGVISVLDRYGLRPDVVAGSSAGALVGAYLAYGYSLDDMRRFMRSQRTSSLFSLRFDGLGLLRNDAFRDYLRRHFGDCTFEDLEIPFYVVCTDLETGKEIVVNRGSLVEAILASSAIPGIFSPVEIDGRLLVDGGLCNNVPVSVLVNQGAYYTIAVRLHQDYTGLNAFSLRRPRRPADEEGASLALWTERLRATLRGDNMDLPNGIEVLGRAMEIVVSQIESYRLQANKPDVLVTPRVSHVNMLSFWEEKEDIYTCGVEAAEAQAPLLEELARRLTGVNPPASSAVNE